MGDVVSIYEAKTNLSRLVKRAQAGETIYIGAYGRPEAVLAPVPPRVDIAFGVWAELADKDFDYDSIVGPDEEIAADFEASVDR